MRKIRIFCAVLLFVNSHWLLAQSPSKAGLLVLNSIAPTFYLKSLSGEEFFLSDYAGKPRQPWKQPERKTVVLCFFATYCLPCRKEIPELQALADEWKEDAVFVLIDLKEEPEIVTAFIDSNRIRLPVLLDRFGVVGEKYGIANLPALFMIGGDPQLFLPGRPVVASSGDDGESEKGNAGEYFSIVFFPDIH
jgi:thiol-disulfide isomerase/thioredoxin